MGPGMDFNAMMLQRMQEQLGATDQEWQIIEPRLSKVMDLSRDAGAQGMGMGMGMGMGRNRGGNMFGQPGRGRGGDAGGDAVAPAIELSPVQKATQTLQESLQKENVQTAEIRAALTALRSAREKAKQELVKAQSSLREVLTLQQEATLVLSGYLE
jgi:hypothetical protein